MRLHVQESRGGPWVLFLCVASIVAGIGCSHTDSEPGEPVPAQVAAARLIATLRTTRGDLVIEIEPTAAPEAIAQWLRLVEESTSGSGAGAADPDGPYYDGLAFTFTRPHVEIVTEARRPEGGGVELTVELNAASLGLDRRIIEDRAEAMKVLQWELIRAHAKMGKGEDRPERLKQWIEEWRATGSADFLIGTSWQEINEALGYEYRRGLQSLPVTSGAVALQPLSPTRASMRLSIAIADMPQRTGRWMVIGRVVEGLEVAEEISVQTLRGQGTPEAKNFEPLDPVIIDRVDVETVPSVGNRAPDENGMEGAE
jgi:cyclophilin family peptidyl-prolyl cis-trans isomerase